MAHLLAIVTISSLAVLLRVPACKSGGFAGAMRTLEHDAGMGRSSPARDRTLWWRTFEAAVGRQRIRHPPVALSPASDCPNILAGCRACERAWFAEPLLASDERREHRLYVGLPSPERVAAFPSDAPRVDSVGKLLE